MADAMTVGQRVSIALIAGLVATTATAAEPVDFAHQVVPILRTHCAACHTGTRAEGGLSMNTRELMLESKAIVPGQAAASPMHERVTSDDADLRMPPSGKRLTADEVAILTRWIDGGANWEPGFRFDGAVEVRPLALREVALPEPTAGRTHPVDRIVDAYLAEQGLELPPAVNDATLARRLFLDLVGLPPTPEQVEQFVADESGQKVARLVDELLADRRAYADHWLTFWNDLLRNDYAGTGFIDGGRQQITGWLYKSLVDNKPYDELTRQLIAPEAESRGFVHGIRWRGRINASQRTEVQFAQNVSQVFLGINMKCASCHDSFINQWKLSDAYGLAAIVATEPLEVHRCDKPTGTMAEAQFLYPELGTIDPKLPQPERLKQAAQLLTSPQDGRFARTLVNRLWHRLMGRALVEPVDAMDAPAWSEDLLDYLAGELVSSGYDIKYVLRLITTSRAYGARSVTETQRTENAEFIYHGPLPKRLTAEQFVDSIWAISHTGPGKAHAKVDRPPAGFAVGPEVRASLVVADPVMRGLGRPNREQVVTTRPDELTTLEALELSNGQPFHAMLDAAAKQLLRDHAEATSDGLADHIFRAALGRLPGTEEKQLALEILGDKPDAAGIAELLWVVVMLPEFQILS